jgi:SnoaL-like domain
MPHDIATLLTRNLHEVFGEGNPDRRRAAIEDLYTEDAVFYDPQGIHRGRAAINEIAGKIRAMHPDFRYTAIRPPEALHDTAGRLQWISGLPGAPAAYSGTDFIVARDGRIAALYLFFDSPPV